MGHFVTMYVQICIDARAVTGKVELPAYSLCVVMTRFPLLSPVPVLFQGRLTSPNDGALATKMPPVPWWGSPFERLGDTRGRITTRRSDPSIEGRYHRQLQTAENGADLITPTGCSYVRLVTLTEVSGY